MFGLRKKFLNWCEKGGGGRKGRGESRSRCVHVANRKNRCGGGRDAWKPNGKAGKRAVAALGTVGPREKESKISMTWARIAARGGNEMKIATGGNHSRRGRRGGDHLGKGAGTGGIHEGNRGRVIKSGGLKLPTSGHLLLTVKVPFLSGSKKKKKGHGGFFGVGGFFFLGGRSRERGQKGGGKIAWWCHWGVGLEREGGGKKESQMYVQGGCAVQRQRAEMTLYRPTTPTPRNAPEVRRAAN